MAGSPKFDLWNLKVVAEIRAGINTRNLAVSSDGKVVMVANYLPHTLVALDSADLAPIKLIPVVGASGKFAAKPRASRPSTTRDRATVSLPR